MFLYAVNSKLCHCAVYLITDSTYGKQNYMRDNAYSVFLISHDSMIITNYSIYTIRIHCGSVYSTYKSINFPRMFADYTINT